MNLECPFCSIKFSPKGGTCGECGYEVQVDGNGAGRFFCKPERDNGIYSRYEKAYEELAQDDLASPVYSLDFQKDLAEQKERK